jgi:hypothetical protein
METIYKWSLGAVNAKKTFTDKNNILRENVIHGVELIYEGYNEETLQQESEKTIVVFDLFDLSLFKDYTELSKSTILEWALSKINPRQKQNIEDSVKLKLNDLNLGESSNNVILQINETTN